MPNEPGAGAGDALSRAIAECRAELNRWIDEQIARAGELTGTPRAELVRRAPRPSPAAEPVAKAAGDPRQRLDALARRLDGRMKRAGAETGDSRESEGEGG